MKLIVAGATGFVGTEIVRQSVSDPRITSLIALSRKPMSPPDTLGEKADRSKFRNVLMDDYETYSDDVKAEFEGAEGCIWYASNEVKHMSTFKTKSKPIPSHLPQ